MNINIMDPASYNLVPMEPIYLSVCWKICYTCLICVHNSIHGGDIVPLLL